MARHVEGMLRLQKMGSVTFDYGNNIRTFAFQRGVKNAYDFPGFVPAYIRPLFCEGRGPFRWAALSGEASDIAVTDDLVLELFPENRSLRRWIELARKRIKFQGLPARICWLGYGERARFGLAINELVKSGKIKAPIVIGRDHLDCGSVASPFRETESMKDGTDAVADWPLLNALVNTAAGASWVSIHNGGGVGIGYSLHAGQVTVADGTEMMARRIERVLTTDPGMGVIRHVDAGYEEAREFAEKNGVRIPMGRDSCPASQHSAIRRSIRACFMRGMTGEHHWCRLHRHLGMASLGRLTSPVYCDVCVKSKPDCCSPTSDSFLRCARRLLGRGAALPFPNSGLLKTRAVLCVGGKIVSVGKTKDALRDPWLKKNRKKVIGDRLPRARCAAGICRFAHASGIRAVRG